MNCYFYTFGCKVNTCETAGMQSLLQSAGYTVVSQPEEADIFLFNSCTVTASGDSRLRHAMRKVRREHPDALLVLTGCYPQAYPDEAAAIPEADLVLGTKHRSRLPGLLAELCQNHARIAAVDSYGAQDDFEALPCDTMPDNTRAFLKIQDGCNCFCSYCIIPYARGRCRSLPPEELRKAAAGFAENGYREIVLCGINLGFYGMEWDGSLAEAVETCAAVPGVERVRLGSLEPERLTEERHLSAHPAVLSRLRHYHRFHGGLSRRDGRGLPGLAGVCTADGVCRHARVPLFAQSRHTGCGVSGTVQRRRKNCPDGTGAESGENRQGKLSEKPDRHGISGAFRA